MTLVKFNDNKKVNGYLPFNEIFDSFLKDGLVNDRIASKVPAVNVSETKDHFHIELAVPGLKKEDFKIAIDKEVLSVSAETKNEDSNQEKKFNRKEFDFSSFLRTFNLPELVDHANIEAAYNDGILKIDIAKKEEAKIKSREISIK